MDEWANMGAGEFVDLILRYAMTAGGTGKPEGHTRNKGVFNNPFG